MTPLKTMRRACIFSSFFFVCACVCLREGWLNLKKSSAKQRKLPCSCWLLTYYSAMRLALSKKQLANVAVVRCRTTHGIGKQIKGGVVSGKPGTRSMSALPHIEPTRVRA